MTNFKYFGAVNVKIVNCSPFSTIFSRLVSSKIADLLRKMPKEPKAAAELRHIRIKAKVASQNKVRPAPSEVYLSVLGNGGVGNPRCLYMFTDHARYIFNCGEGTQRLAHEHKMKLAKLEHLFFTANSWQNIGGLPGLSLTIQDIGVPEIHLHGPPGLGNLFEMTKSYMVTKDLSIVTNQPEDKFFSDHSMRVDYVPLLSNTLESCDNSNQLNILNSVLRQKETEEASIEPTKKKPKLEDVKRSCDISVAYICKLHSKPGQLQIAKCVEQGVPPGPLLGILKNGNDVTLPNGRVVKASEVVSPEDPGSVFIVLECPHEGFLDSLINEQSFKNYQEPRVDPDKLASLVVHFSPPYILRNERYQEWMKRFPPSTFHLFLNSDSPRLSSTAVHRVQLALNHLDSKVFPKLKEEETVDDVSGSDVMGVQASSLMKFYLRPLAKKGLDRSSTLKLTNDVFQEDLDQLKNMDAVINELKSQVAALESECGGEEFPKIIFLGTGSSIPSKIRNVSAILVTLSSNSTMLLDCGEGTYGQLVRFSDKSGAKEILMNLKAVFISHLHADHHLGLVNLLQRREEMFKEADIPCPTLDILAPLQIMWWFINYHKLFEPLMQHIRLVPNYLLLHNQREASSSDYDEIKTKLGLNELLTVEVRHCKFAYGIVLTTSSGFKLVYSGDTMPSEKLIEAGQNCSLLIHEATMEDDLEIEAVIKTHSTTSQAIEVGKKMNAKFTLLTHFSQRYAKIPIFNENFNSNIGFAFDNMMLSIDDLPKLNLLIPPLKAFFKEQYEEMQEKTAKMKKQKEIMNSISSNEIKS